MRAARDLAIVGLGELLWDELPTGPRLGGAPANFAVMAARLGVHGIVASRLGEDARGEQARATLARLPVDTRFLQSDPERPTGRVSVRLEDGQPRYTIDAPAAWDALELTPAWRQLAERADAVCWGTLAQRDALSESTIHGFVAATRSDCLRVFDANLRAPFFTAEAVQRSLGKATILKASDEEWPHLFSLAGLPAATAYKEDDERECTAALTGDARQLLAIYSPIDLVAITLGKRGSLQVTRDEAVRHPGVPCEAVDTVGAGDAFAAALVVHRLLKEPLATQSEAANRWGAWMASQAGGMPDLPDETTGDTRRAIGPRL